MVIEPLFAGLLSIEFYNLEADEILLWLISEIIESWISDYKIVSLTLRLWSLWVIEFFLLKNKSSRLKEPPFLMMRLYSYFVILIDILEFIFDRTEISLNVGACGGPERILLPPIRLTPDYNLIASNIVGADAKFSKSFYFLRSSSIY